MSEVSSAKSGRDVVPGFGDRLREVRKRAHMTLADLADAAGTGPGALSDIETGRRSPSLRLAWQLARALDVSLDSLCPAVES